MAIYLANDKYAAVLTSGYTAGQNTLYVSAVPDNVPTIIVAAKGTDNETVFAVTGSTVNSLTGVTRLKGANVDLDSQTPLTCLNNEEFVNQFAGAVSTPETLKNIIYAEDGGSSDDYAISLDPAPSEYVAGMLVSFKANTANTGAATLNVNSLGAKAIKKNHDEDLATGDIEAGQVVTVVYDGTNFQLQSVSPAKATGAEITTGTEENKFATPKALADAGVNTRLASKVIRSTRDLTADSGDVSYTGVGFRPSAIIAIAFISSGTTGYFSMGVVGNNRASGSVSRYSTTDTIDSINAIYLGTAPGTRQYATVKSWDSDGFTLTWTKNGSPTGIAQMTFLCLG
jgi:hypothetical protein